MHATFVKLLSPSLCRAAAAATTTTTTTTTTDI
jgi:hypothetical protein